MNAKLRALLVASAVLVAGGVSYYAPKLNTSLAEMADAGVRADCAIRKVACTFLDDAGYDEREFFLANCPNLDGGRPERIIPRAIARATLDQGLHDFQGQCMDLGPAASINFRGDAPASRAFSCACLQADAGACLRLDGGSLNAGEVARAGEWSGPGCKGTPCSEVFGFSSYRCNQ